ncbi:MAG: hypothetical protein LBB72_01470 [Spirochaetaceae bacterium]|nr:hypothetical protein [Spirochaetaceae bacterium]
MDIFFEFANTFTEESVLYAEIKQRKEKAKEPTSDVMRSIGYSEADIAGMDIER